MSINIHPRDRAAPKGAAFTAEQKLDFHTFELQNHPKLNAEGGRKFGHTDPRSTGLTPERHRFVLENYAALRAACTGCDHKGRHGHHDD